MILSAKLMVDKDTSRHRGFAFITFADKASADLACQKRFHSIAGKEAEVKPAKTRSPHAPSAPATLLRKTTQMAQPLIAMPQATTQVFQQPLLAEQAFQSFMNRTLSQAYAYMQESYIRQQQQQQMGATATSARFTPYPNLSQMPQQAPGLLPVSDLQPAQFFNPVAAGSDAAGGRPAMTVQQQQQQPLYPMESLLPAAVGASAAMPMNAFGFSNAVQGNIPSAFGSCPSTSVRASDPTPQAGSQLR